MRPWIDDRSGLGMAYNPHRQDRDDAPHGIVLILPALHNQAAGAFRRDADEMGQNAAAHANPIEGEHGADPEPAPASRADQLAMIYTARMNALSKLAFWATFIVTLPQIAAAVSVLATDGELQRERSCKYAVSVWVAVQATRLAASLLLKGRLLHILVRQQLPAAQINNSTANSVNAVVTVFGVIWLIYGSSLLGDTVPCADHGDAPIRRMALAMLIVDWFCLVFPCLLVVMLVPLLTCCAPVVLRTVAWTLAEDAAAAAGQGAPQNRIDDIPEERFARGQSEGGLSSNSSCAICLQNFAEGDVCRKLRCRHLFHKDCIDPWLQINSTCCLCRRPALGRAGELAGAEAEQAAEMAAANAAAAAAVDVEARQPPPSQSQPVRDAAAANPPPPTPPPIPPASAVGSGAPGAAGRESGAGERESGMSGEGGKEEPSASRAYTPLGHGRDHRGRPRHMR